jgi:hypothetical protein
MSPSPADPSAATRRYAFAYLQHIAAQLGGDLGKRERELVREAITWLPTTP